MTPSWNMKCDPCSVISEWRYFFSFSHLILFDWHESDDILYLHAVFLPSRRPLFLLDTHNMCTHLSISFFLLLRLSSCDRKHMLQLFPVSGQTLAFDSQTHTETQTQPSIHDPASIYPSFYPLFFIICISTYSVLFRKRLKPHIFVNLNELVCMWYLHPDCDWYVWMRCVQSWVQVGLWGSWPRGSGPESARCNGTWSPESRSGPWVEVLVHLT